MAKCWVSPLPITYSNDRILAHDESLNAESQDLVDALTVSCIKGNLCVIKQRLPEDADLQPVRPLLGALALYN